MRAVTLHQGQLEVQDIPDLRPAKGQVLIDVTRCGICGSDLHARVHGDATADAAAEIGYDQFMRSDQRVVMGHEFTGTIAEYGPGTRKKWPTGSSVVAMPILDTGRGVHLVGLSELAPGAYAEQVLVSEALTFPVPGGLSPDVAALTEPLAVALHAVNRGDVGAKDTAVVIGCGPIGLAVILMLKAKGVRTVIASDYSVGRRELARRCGADVIVDPGAESPWSTFADSKTYLTQASSLFELAVDSMTKLRSVPLLPWNRVLETAQKLGAGPRGPVVFECVGMPGVIEHIVTSAPLLSRVVVVGVCMEPDTFRPVMAINKEIELRFALGYDPAEFHRALMLTSSGKVDPTPLVTGTVGLDGVATAFDQLGDPELHAKILVDPALA
ncbi:zinc-binding dehydrogenase [Aeromicrobium sp.]|uniref:zinc-binding dehydrogenase n=1 Tax=Aeromicrobium sp. TaxID=1871063 RepID=UPI0030C3F997